MAATWTVEIVVLDIPKRRTRIVGTRTDGANVRTFMVNDFYFRAVSGAGLTADLVEIVSLMKAQYQEQSERESQIAAVDTAITSKLETALNAAEPM